MKDSFTIDTEDMFKLWWQWALTIALLALLVVGCTLLFRQKEASVPTNPPLIGNQRVNHLMMGNPSNARVDPNNYLLPSSESLDQPRPYVTSYNRSRNIPNWSSWQLNQSWLGSSPRRNDFRPDPTLPMGWYQVKSGDYNSSGYDRGHMTPAADRDNTPQNISATFLMTNIVPQAPDNNQGPWAQLENYSRSLAEQGKELYIIAGGYGNARSIRKNNVKITVPDQVWKVIVIMDKPGLTAKDVTTNTRVIAVDMPNQQGIKETNWRKYRVSVDLVEERTGYDLLSNVPDATQVRIEEKVDQVVESVK